MLLFASPLGRPLNENGTPGEDRERLVRLVAGGALRPGLPLAGATGASRRGTDLRTSGLNPLTGAPVASLRALAPLEGEDRERPSSSPSAARPGAQALGTAAATALDSSAASTRRPPERPTRAKSELPYWDPGSTVHRK